MKEKICLRNTELAYDRIYESRSGGWVDLHPLHGEDEFADNLDASRVLADNGFQIELLPCLHSNETELRKKWLPDVYKNKNPDIRINGNLIGDFKKPTGSEMVRQSTINWGIYSAAQQKVDIAILNLYKRVYAAQDVKKGIIGAMQPDRNKSIQSVWLITRNQHLFRIDRKIVFDDSIYEVLDQL